MNFIHNASPLTTSNNNNNNLFYNYVNNIINQQIKNQKASPLTSPNLIKDSPNESQKIEASLVNQSKNNQSYPTNKTVKKASPLASNLNNNNISSISSTNSGNSSNNKFYVIENKSNNDLFDELYGPGKIKDGDAPPSFPLPK